MGEKKETKIEQAHRLMRAQLDKHGYVDRQPIIAEMDIDAPTFASFLQRVMQVKSDPLVLTSDAATPGRYTNNDEAAKLFKEAYAKTDAARGTTSALTEEEKKLQAARKGVLDNVRKLRISVAHLKFVDGENAMEWLTGHVIKDLDVAEVMPQRKPLTPAEKKAKAAEAMTAAAKAGEEGKTEGQEQNRADGGDKPTPQAPKAGGGKQPGRTRTERK